MTLETSPMNTIYYISNKIMITTIIITTMEIIYIYIYMPFALTFRLTIEL